MQLHRSTRTRRLLLLFAAVFALTCLVVPAAWASPIQHDKDDCKRSTVPCKQADLSIKKSASAVGADDFIFTITVKNNSKIAAEKVVITDQLSKRFDLEWVRGPGCKSGKVISCKVGTLGAGKSVTITLRVDVEPDNFRGKITNTASVTSATKDPNTKNNSSSVTVTAKGHRK